MKYPIEKILSTDKEFPALLQGISPRVREIYFRGNINFENNNFAVVGTRIPSSYGKQACFSLVPEISQAGLNIISGMALGIDSFAHQAALETDGQTIAVIGSGLDEKTIYPQENKKLANQILDNNGCLISEYSPGTPGLAFRFLERNRLIAALSSGIMIVEARYKSGSLNTAAWAKKFHKKIFALPGSIFSQTSKGAHLLLEQGALPAVSSQYILKELGLAPRTKIASRSLKNPSERKLISALKNGAVHIDELVSFCKMPISEILITLANLEIKSKVKNLGEGLYSIKE